MTDLADFLLARFAEDEARAWELQAAYNRDEVRPPARLVNLFALTVPSHAIAECEAKRRIVELYQREADVTARTPASGPKTPQEARSGALGEACLLLALPYADHPGYRAEWKL